MERESRFDTAFFQWYVTWIINTIQISTEIIKSYNINWAFVTSAAFKTFHAYRMCILANAIYTLSPTWVKLTGFVGNMDIDGNLQKQTNNNNNKRLFFGQKAKIKSAININMKLHTAQAWSGFSCTGPRLFLTVSTSASIHPSLFPSIHLSITKAHLNLPLPQPRNKEQSAGRSLFF